MNIFRYPLIINTVKQNEKGTLFGGTVLNKGMCSQWLIAIFYGKASAQQCTCVEFSGYLVIK